MVNFLIRTIILSILFCGVVLWYYIPDQYFIAYGEERTKDDDIKLKEKKEALKKIQKEKIIIKKKKEKKPLDLKNVRILQSVPSSYNEMSKKNTVKQPVPFVVQAPHAQWEDQRYQDACEEASMLMIKKWIDGKWRISKSDAEKEIEKMFTEERKIFSNALDTSVVDTARFFQSYYKHPVIVYQNILMNDIYKLLAQGHVIIAPTNGKMLRNPNYTHDGPDRHMLVIIGYNKDNREFITNDPGTRVGSGYKYKDTILYNAIRDYHTGNKKDIADVRKNIIAIKKDEIK